MFVPECSGVALATALVATIAWGSWSVPFKYCADRISFEGFYVNFSVGILLTSVVLTLVLGTDAISSSAASVADDFGASVGRERFFYAVAAGVVFNLANLGLCKSIDLMGLAVAFPLAIGMALVVGTLVNYAISPSGSILLLILGLVLGFAAVCGVAFVQILKERECPARGGLPEAKHEATTASEEDGRPSQQDAAVGGASQAQSGDAAAPVEDGQTLQMKPERQTDGIAATPSFARKLFVTVVSGSLMSFWSPLATLAIEDIQSAGDPLTPYGEYVLFCLAILVSTLFVVPVICRSPLEGGASKPLGPLVRDYGRAPASAHVLSVVSGVIWGIGGSANIVGAASTALSPATSYGIGQAAPMMAIFWGVFLFKEFAGTSIRVRVFLLAVVVLFLGAITSFFVSKTVHR